MDKLRMQTANKADENFKKLAAMFPNAVTETINENGEVVRAIDKDVLMQEISCTVVDGNEERYQFTWPDKKKSVLLANAPINKTLRPVREDETVPSGADSEGKPYCSTGSVDFDTTENLYIEGDNLEVLKLLQETYLGKIKMIYIDPPYNTGNDFVYNDEFGIGNEEFLSIAENGHDAIEHTKSAFERVDISHSLDTGFRVLKCDTSNMKDVYYNPAEYEVNMFSRLEDNIKEDRTPEDLLFQVMLDLGVLLSSKIEETTIAGKKVFNVEDNYLIACFDSDVSEETIKAIAKQKPYYFVMRDSSMASDSVATNFDQIFATYSPDTVRKVL